MSLEIHHRQKEEIEILDLKGCLTMGNEDLVFREEFKRVVEAKMYKVILNLRDVSVIDSAAVGTLVFAHTRLANLGGRLAILNPQLSHLELFVLLKLELFFDVYDDEIDAVNSFFPDRVVTRFDLLTMIEKLAPKRGSSESHSRT